MASWDTGDYQRIVGAERQGDMLFIRFGDGTEVSVATKCLLPAAPHGVDWDALTFDPYEIIVPTATEPVEIPWSAIRTLTDRDYAKHLANAAKAQARQIGFRIRQLREQRGLSGRELAARAGMTPQSLSRIEHGHHDVVYTTLQQLLVAMGASLKDLVAVSEGGASL